MPPLTDEDRARLEEEGRQALKLLGNALFPVVLALLSGQPVAWAGVLLPLAGQLSKLVSPKDVALLLNELLILGKLTWTQALAVRAWLALHAPATVAGLEEAGASGPFLIPAGPDGLPGALPLHQAPPEEFS